jgi:hypothetical protein
VRNPNTTNTTNITKKILNSNRKKHFCGFAFLRLNRGRGVVLTIQGLEEAALAIHHYISLTSSFPAPVAVT